MSEKKFRWSRFFSLIIFFIVLLTLLFFGGLHIFLSKEKASAWIIGICFIPSFLMSCTFTYIVSKGSTKESIKEFLSFVGDKTNGIVTAVRKKDGTMIATTSTSINPIITNNPVI